MIIAGITGDIGHGKTTVADFLAEQSHHSQHIETWELVAEIAEPLTLNAQSHPEPNDIPAINEWLQPLPDLIQTHTHTIVGLNDIMLTPDRVAQHPVHYDKLFQHLELIGQHPQLASTPITIDTKETFRPLLQWVGGYLALQVRGLWYREIVRRIKNVKHSGLALVTVGGVRYPIDAEILRNAGGYILEIVRPDFGHQDSTDLTERQRSAIQPDSRIINNGTTKDLEACAAVVWNDLTRRDLQAEYQARRYAAGSR